MNKKSNPKDVKKGCLMLIIIVLISIIAVTKCVSKPEKKLTKKEAHIQKIQKLFSAWDGSHIELTKKIKKALNDPQSYEHIETTYRDLDSTLVISTVFTAKNGFGGRLKQEVIVISDTSGNITNTLKWLN